MQAKANGRVLLIFFIYIFFQFHMVSSEEFGIRGISISPKARKKELRTLPKIVHEIASKNPMSLQKVTKKLVVLFFTVTT